MVLSLMVQVFWGVLALIPVAVAAGIVVYLVDLTFISSFRFDPLYDEEKSAKGVRYTRVVIQTIGLLFGIFVGYLLLAEILGAFTRWGWIGSATTSLSHILQAWIVMVAISLTLGIIRGVGWLTWYLAYKQKPIRVKPIKKSASTNQELPHSNSNGSNSNFFSGWAIGLVIAFLIVFGFFSMTNQNSQNSFTGDIANSTAQTTTNALGISG